MHFLQLLFVVIFTALPLIYLTSFIEWGKAYYLYDVTMDELERLNPFLAYTILAAVLAIVVLAYVLLARSLL
jgi:hypothetical protein